MRTGSSGFGSGLGGAECLEVSDAGARGVSGMTMLGRQRATAVAQSNTFRRYRASIGGDPRENDRRAAEGLVQHPRGIW